MNVGEGIDRILDCLKADRLELQALRARVETLEAQVARLLERKAVPPLAGGTPKPYERGTY